MTDVSKYTAPFTGGHPLRLALSERVLVLDGAMGTLIQSYGLTEEDYRGDAFADTSSELRGCNDLLPVTRPDVIGDIHRRYLAAGADIVTSCSFNAHPVSLSDYGLADRAYEINYAAARCARRAADEFNIRNPFKRRYAGGSVGPTGHSASLPASADDPSSRSIAFDSLTEGYEVQIEALIDGGADLIQLETFFDTLNARAALMAARRVMRRLGTNLPVMVSGTLTPGGRTLSGQTVEAFYASVAPFEPLTVGFNCSFGAKQLLPHIKALSSVSDYPIAVYPNAGLPAPGGGYEGTAADMASEVEEYMKLGLVNIVGGCCGTAPEHIMLLSEAASRYSPRPVPRPRPRLLLSGTEAVEAPADGGLLIAGERANVAGSARFAKLARAGKWEEAAAVVRAQTEAGARITDVCMDDSSIDAAGAMQRFLLTLAADPAAASAAVMADSSRWEAVTAALKCVQGRPIVNSISLKEGPDEFLRRAREARDYGAAVMVMLFDEKGQADTYERKTEVAERSYRLLTEDGFPARDIVFDPNVLAVATGMEEHDRCALDFIRACRWIRGHLPEAAVSAGVSNLSFAFRGANRVREALHSVFLHHAAAAGLGMAIANPSALVPYDELDGELRLLAEDVVLARRPDAARRLADYAAREKAAAETSRGNAGSVRKADGNAWRTLGAAERIRHAMLEGITDYVAADSRETAAAAEGGALEVIDTVFMPAMEHIGRLFGEGRMFLPQIVRAARVMKLGVEAIMPPSEGGTSGFLPGEAGRKKVLVATVRGDVHDIGKNIASVVMSCNGYLIRDMGVMVPAADIADAAVAWNADAVGLSALITPSLEEMASVLREMQRRGTDIPVLIAGATTSDEHTARALAPLYDGPVIHARDAADNIGILNALCGPERDKFLDETFRRQKTMRDEAETKGPELVPLAEARRQAKVKNAPDTPQPALPGTEYHTDYPADEVVPLIDWNFFFHAWGISGRWPDILDSPDKGKQARRLWDDAQAALAEATGKGLLTLCGAAGIYPVRREGDDIHVTAPGGRDIVFPMLRRQRRGGETPSAADFIAPNGDFVGAFAVSAGIGLEEWISRLRAEGDHYGAIMAKLLADRLTEALAEAVHRRVRRVLWGYEQEPEQSPADIIAGRYRGIRLAFGYPATPDHSLKREAFDLLGVEGRIPLSLTENHMISPGESLCGLMFAGPGDRYFAVGPVGTDQTEDYALRRGISSAQAKILIPKNILFR